MAYTALKSRKYLRLNCTVTNIVLCQRNSIPPIIQILLLLLPPPQPIRAIPITMTLIPIPMISKNQSTGHLTRPKTTSENP
jgi:hypothetical protein